MTAHMETPFSELEGKTAYKVSPDLRQSMDLNLQGPLQQRFILKLRGRRRF
jgi:hypothetical protein